MTTWIGGGNNEASNPSLWSSHTAPVAGDTLSVTAGPGNSGPFTMNVSNNALAGDTVSINAPLTANLARKAVMTANVTGAAATFNLKPRAQLTVTGTGGTLTANLTGDDTANVSANLGDRATVNVVGNDSGTIGASRASATVTLAPGARFNGTLNAGYAGTIAVQGVPGATFNNNGDSKIGGPGANATVGADIVGHGTFAVDPLGHLEFMQAVGAGQSIQASGSVAIDKPAQFNGSVTLLGGPARIDLAGLAGADSYSFKNDILRIWSGNNSIDTLRLTDQTQHGFVVEAPTSSGHVSIASIYDPSNIPAGLPIHSIT